MKKNIIILCILPIVIFSYGCKSNVTGEEIYPANVETKTNDSVDSDMIDDNTDNVADDNSVDTLDKDVEEIVQSEQLENSDADKTPEVDLRFDSAPLNFLSVEDMVNALKTKEYNDPLSNKIIKNDKRFEIFETDRITRFFMLNTEIPNYTLSVISVSYNAIEFCYDPIKDIDKKKHPLDYNFFTRIYVTYYREDRETSENAMAEILNQLSDQADKLIEEDFIYSPTISTAYCPVEKSKISITVPSGMNSYEILRPLCVTKEVSLK